ncbi:MAG TPA: hypothetical protein DHW82_11935 [Spirochaetia bacterium]|nr:MAG: hypothetical protein A2Y41_12470 [Spirochaetes bacterium GWB1_36_13]HCL57700.1 hypothetical protein [Spirochaetia bacterium]
MKKILLILSFFFLGISFSYAQEEIQFLAVLQKNYPKEWKNPSEYVLEDGYLYQGVNYSITGGTHVYADASLDLEKYAGKTVLLKGSFQKDLNRILIKGEKVPENYGDEESKMQIRSDWVGEETGFNIGHSTKEKLKQVSYFQITSIEEYQGKISFTQKGKTVLFIFENQLIDISKAEVIVHYETNGYGKPSPYYETVKIKNLKKGKIFQKTIPLIVKIKAVKKDKITCSMRDIVLKYQSGSVQILVQKFVSGE